MASLRWAILLNSLFIALELAAGFAVNSLALISDAWHNLTDVLALGIAWFAVRQIRRPADSVRTFGYHRAGILVGVFILAGAWRIVREAVNVLMEGTPRGLDLEEVSGTIAHVPGVRGVHHLHVWSLGSDLTALSCHVVVEDQPVSTGGLVLERIRKELLDRFGIGHATIQLETVVPQAADPLSIHASRVTRPPALS